MKKSKVFIPAMLSVFSLVLLPVNLTMASPVVASNAKVKMAGNDHVAAAHGTLKGHKSATDKVSLTLSLNLRNADQLDSFIADLYNPSSSNYKNFLTPDQFTAQFGPTASDVSKVTDYATANGLSVDSVSSNNELVTVSGTASQIENTFGVTLNNYTNAKGQSYFANAENPSIPAEIAGVLNGVTGLDNEAKMHTSAKQKPAASTTQEVAGKPNLMNPNVGSGPTGGYTPTELRSAYDATPLISSGVTGSGQNVALVEFDGYVQTNITTYYNQYGLASPTPTKVLVDGYSGAAGSGQGEVELDIEIINAMAPAAHVYVYEAPNSDTGELDMYQKIATDNTSKTVSISWGLCELNANATTMSSLHNILSQMATQGQSVYAASGDSGAYDCSATQLSVDNPANDPYVTGVGGTNLTLSGGAYSSEKVWANTSNKSGGGGGISTIYAKPTWQTGTGTTNSYSNGKRQVPDVSADADPATGYSIYSAGSWVVYGGTSCAAPLWAGITALNNHYAANNAKPNLGQANPTLYKMFNTAQTYSAYHDITTGTNLYYPATAGYDQATGIGTPDAYNLIRDINGAGGGGGGGTTEKMTNGGFESGSTSWTESSSGAYEIVSTSRPHTGLDSAFLAGYNNGNDAIYQTVAIPSTATTATLSFWTYVSTTETSHPYDFFYAKLRNTSGTALTTLLTLNDGTATGWVQHSYDVSAYKGQTVQVYFNGTNDVSNTTSFFVDDVSLLTN